MAEYATKTPREQAEATAGQLDQDYRKGWRARHEDLCRYIAPHRGRFALDEYNQVKKRTEIVNNAAPMALRTMRAGMTSGITSPARPWFQLGLPDPDQAQSAPVKRWLHTVQQRMRDLLLTSNYYNALPVVYGDLGTAATAVMLMVEDRQDVLRCYVPPLGSYRIGTNERGVVDTYVREARMTVKQVVERFGDRNAAPGKRWANFSQRVRDAYRRGDYFQPVDVQHLIAPNPEADPRALEAKYKPVRSVYWETGAREAAFLLETGFDESPLLAPRWEVTGEDPWGTNCPGLEALGDIKSLQLLEKQKAQANEKAIKPPLQAPSSMAGKRVSQIPGDVTFVNVRDGMQGIKPLYEVRFDTNPVLEDIAAHTQRISRAFFEDLFLMLAQSDRRQITAREIEERHEEKLLQLGPVLERLNDELLDPTIDRVFGIMLRAGRVPPPPPELEGIELRVEYISIMAQAQKLVGLAGLERFTGFVGRIAEAKPDALDKIDTDAAIDDYGDMTGISPAILRSAEEVGAVRTRRAEAQRRAAQAEQTAMAAQSAKTLAETPTDGDNALTRVLGLAGGGA